MDLSWNRVDGVARSAWFCSGTGGNIRCRKDQPLFHTGERQLLEHFVIEMLSESSGARLISALLIRKAPRANG